MGRGSVVRTLGSMLAKGMAKKSEIESARALAKEGRITQREAQAIKDRIISEQGEAGYQRVRSHFLARQQETGTQPLRTSVTPEGVRPLRVDEYGQEVRPATRSVFSETSKPSTQTAGRTAARRLGREEASARATIAGTEPPAPPSSRVEYIQDPKTPTGRRPPGAAGVPQPYRSQESFIRAGFDPEEASRMATPLVPTHQIYPVRFATSAESAPARGVRTVPIRESYTGSAGGFGELNRSVSRKDYEALKLAFGKGALRAAPAAIGGGGLLAAHEAARGGMLSSRAFGKGKDRS